jgi:hypothetical protein
VHNTIYQSGKSPEARAWLVSVPKTEALVLLMPPTEFRTAFWNRSSEVVSPCDLPLLVWMLTYWPGRPHAEVPHQQNAPSACCARLAEMIRCPFGWAEVTGIFYNVYPTSHQRMDLVVYDLGRPNLLYDVVVTNPLRSNANRLTAKIPTPPGRRGTTR